MATSPQVTYDTVGIKEDVSEVIGLISPFDTPCYSSWKKPACHNTIVQWQEDALRAPAANAAVEGSDVTIADYNPTVMKDNRTQLFEETAQVSSTVQATDRYGRGSEMDYRVMKKSREVRARHRVCLRRCQPGQGRWRCLHRAYTRRRSVVD